MQNVNEQVVMRYELLFGFNTKQWWVYDSKQDVYIDIPTKVLDELNNIDFELQEDRLAEIIMCEPNWLNDTEYYYDSDIDI